MKAVFSLRVVSCVVLSFLIVSALIVPVLARSQRPSAKTSPARPAATQSSTPGQAKANGPDQPMESDDTIKLGTELVNVIFSVVDRTTGSSAT